MVRAHFPEANVSSLVRRNVMSGNSFWCAVAFAILGISVTVLLFCTLLFGLDTVSGFGKLMPEANLLLYSDKDAFIAWFPEAVERFREIRGGASNNPVSWVVIVVVGAVLFFSRYLRFMDVKGRGCVETRVCALQDCRTFSSLEATESEF